jgi:hypothetical protein
VEWDFDHARPAPTWPHGLRPWVLSREGPRTLVIGGANCARTLASSTGAAAQPPDPPPRSTPVTPCGFGPVCRQLTGYTWSGNQLLLG